MIARKDCPSEARAGKLSVALILGLAAASVVSCLIVSQWNSSQGSPASRAGPQNLLLVTLDTTRADHLGCYGNKAAATPFMDSLAGGGVLCRRCIAPSPITLPSHSTILTGLQPYSHGVRNNGTHRLAGSVRTLAERLDAMGLATGAVISSFVLDSRFGLDQGFDEYDDDLSSGAPQGDFGFRETIAEDGVRRAQNWLESLGDERWFLWLHLFDPHASYIAPEPFLTRFRDNPYDGEIAYSDAMLGRLLDFLRRRQQLAETLVVLTSDHGESLGEHDEETHGVFIHDATTWVPLILSHPSLAQGLELAAVVSSVDIVPTVLELLGAAPEGPFDGHSLAPLVLGTVVESGAGVAYSESMLPYYNFGWAEMRALRSDDMRYVRAPSAELYDLENDPGELQNIASQSGDALNDWEARLAARLPDHEANSLVGDPEDLDPEVVASLAALGYTFAADRAAQQAERADPKDALRLLIDYHEAEAMLARGESAAAEAVYRRLIAEQPRAIMIRNSLADLLVRLDRQRDSLEVQMGSVGMLGFSATNALCIAELRHDLGLEGWQASLDLARQLDPRDPLPWVREARFGRMPSDPAGAIELYRKALEIDGRCALAWIGIAEAEAARRSAAAAQFAARKATEADPTLPRGWFMLGSMSAVQGEQEQAVMAFQRARDLKPEDVMFRVGLSLAYDGLGKTHEAQTELRAAAELDLDRVRQMAAGNANLERILRAVQ